jgi:hypothetical protein
MLQPDGVQGSGATLFILKGLEARERTFILNSAAGRVNPVIRNIWYPESDLGPRIYNESRSPRQKITL